VPVAGVGRRRAASCPPPMVGLTGSADRCPAGASATYPVGGRDRPGWQRGRSQC
jgi:hypothetical protein